jgi:hypothetical protein
VDLKQNIREEVAAISPNMLHRVMPNFQKRLGECVDNKGCHLTDTTFRECVDNKGRHLTDTTFRECVDNNGRHLTDTIFRK